MLRRTPKQRSFTQYKPLNHPGTSRDRSWQSLQVPKAIVLLTQLSGSDGLPSIVSKSMSPAGIEDLKISVLATTGGAEQHILTNKSSFIFV